MDQSEQDRKALQDFIVENAELEKLEALLDRFNIFEAVGMERQEIRHSKFLAFLLDPKEPHGMGDAFVKRLLQRAVMDEPNVAAPVTPIELSLWDLWEMGVWREWRRIDIFLLDERQKLAVIIENKIDTSEHGDQLDRYYEAVREEYPDHKILALYLKPGGEEPSHPDYLPVDYQAVCEILDGLAESQASVMEPDVRVLITHYTEMLRRHIVGDSEIARLSREIYQKHQQALDLVYEHIPDRRNSIRQIVEELVSENPNLTLDHTTKGEVKFAVSDWDTSVNLNKNRWSVLGRILLFVISNTPSSVDLKLMIGPGEANVREGFWQIANFSGAPFKVVRKLAKEHNTVYTRSVVRQTLLEEGELEEIDQEIREHWADFIENDLPRIDAAMKQEAWIWEPEASEASFD